MKQLIALAAVLGLAVSSWGLTVQAAPSAHMASGTTASVSLEAQVGAHFAWGLWQYTRRPGAGVIYYDNFGWDGLLGGHLAAIGGTIGGIIGGSVGFAVGGPPGAVIGTMIGAF